MMDWSSSAIIHFYNQKSTKEKSPGLHKPDGRIVVQNSAAHQHSYNIQERRKSTDTDSCAGYHSARAPSVVLQ